MSKTEDPVTIEHSNKQIKTIEKLYLEFKKAIKLSGVAKIVSDTDTIDEKPLLQKRMHDQSKSLTTDCDESVKRR